MGTQFESIVSLAWEVESAISSAIRKTEKNSWDENHLTFKMLERLAPILNGATVNEREERQLTCRAFKAKGRVEQEHGDIAVLVRILYPDGDLVDGVGYLEAKRRDWSLDRFSAMKVDQLRREYRQTGHAQVLLYDREPILTIRNSCELSDWTSPPVPQAFTVPVTYAAVVPMELMFDRKRHNRRAYRFALPFSYQLCFRYFQGLDLELDRPVVRQAMDAAEADEVSTAVLTLGIRVGPGGPPPEPQTPTNGRFDELVEGQDLVRRYGRRID